MVETCNECKDCNPDCALHETSIKMKDLTCYTCKEWETCNCSFDLYNINDDCLANK